MKLTGKERMTDIFKDTEIVITEASASSIFTNTKTRICFRWEFLLKKTFCFILITLTLYTLSLPVNSHPGRTDANGGHWNRSTGEYHYHSGEYAGKNQPGKASSDNFVIREKKESKEIETIEEPVEAEESPTAALLETIIFISIGVGILCMILCSVLSVFKSEFAKTASTTLGCSVYIFAMLIPLLLALIRALLIK